MPPRFRRRKETVGDLDVLVSSRHPKEIMNRVMQFEGLAEVLARGETKMTLRLSGPLVQKLRQTEKIPPFDAGAVSMLIRASSRLAEHKAKLTAVFGRICDLIREAAFWAQEDGATVVGDRHVQRALGEQVYRSDLIAARIRVPIREGTFLVSLADKCVGQINGLALADLGDYACD
jgi:predicted ATP-dependent protease